MNTRVIQASPPRTGSTVVTNLIYGLLEPGSAVNFVGRRLPVDERKKLYESELISKTHIDGRWSAEHPREWSQDIDSITQDLEDCDLYFVVSERNCGKVKELISKKYRKYKNVLIFDYSELLETEDTPLEEICENAETKLTNFLPQSILQQAQGGYDQMYKRMIAMNDTYEKIKHEPFSYCDEFYHLHGSHRNRR